MQRSIFSTRPQAKREAIITGEQAHYRFTVIADGILRYEWASDGRFEDRASTFAINRDFDLPRFRHVDKGEEGLEIITDRFHLSYDKKQFSPNGLYLRVLGSLTDYKSVWRYSEHVHDLGGTLECLDFIDGRTKLGPGVISRSGYAVIDDSTSMLFDAAGWVATRTPGPRIDGYVFAYGLDYRAAIKALFSLSGNQPLLPRWSLGNWWSRYYPYQTSEYLRLMDDFSSRGIPLSVSVIDMDWHLVNDEVVKEAGVSGWTGYTWNRKLIPEPEKFMEELHKRNLKVTLNDHPADGIQPYEESYRIVCNALTLDASKGDPIPFDIANRSFCDAYFDILHRKLEDQGCDFWWIDWQQGPYSKIEGINPLWMLNHFQFLDSSRDDCRPISFSRYAGPGSHRYPIGFSGDAIMSWKTLDFQPEFTNTASNIGYGWWSHDIGGHAAGFRDDELVARWVQYGVFSPIMRLHSALSRWATKEPWLFNLESEDAMTTFLRLRHRLVPYLYSMNVRSSKEGEPLCQPMYWHYPRIDEAYRVPNQYYFGSELLVVPITSRRSPTTLMSKVRGWLPPGEYVDIFTGVVYDGNRQLWLHRRLDGYPVFAKEGALVPLDASESPENGCPNPSAMELLVAVGADGFFKLYEDDGMGNSEDVKFTCTDINYSQLKGFLTITPGNKTNNPAIPSIRKWSIRFLAYYGESTVFINGEIAQSGVTTRKVSNGTLVELPETPISARIVVKVSPKAKMRTSAPEDIIYSILQQSRIKFGLKDAVWSAVTAAAPRVGKISRLHAVDMDEDLHNAVLEYLLADVGAD